MKLPQHAEFVGALTSGSAGDKARSPLSPLERQAVDVALCDSLASLREDGRAVRTLRLLFGGRRSPRLADPRLEALRRFVVLVRHAPASLDRCEIERMDAAGFSDRQMDEVFAIVERAPPQPAFSLAGAVVVVAIPTGAAFAAFVWLGTALGDPLIAAVVLGTTLLPIIAMLWPGIRR